MTTRYIELLGQIKQRIKQGQTRAVFFANAEMITMYWDIGHILHDQQQRKGWGARVIAQLAQDIGNELPEVKGFSERNIKLMVQFYHEYPSFLPIRQRAVAQLTDKIPVVQKRDDAELMQQLVAQLPWAHNVILMQKIKGRIRGPNPTYFIETDYKAVA